MYKCPICNSPAKLKPDNWPWYVDCLRCGIFNINESALNRYHPLKLNSKIQMKKQIALFSGWIRENLNVTITERIVNDFTNLKLPSLQDRATNLLKSLNSTYNLLGGSKTINFANLKKIITIIENNEEDENTDFLAKDLKYMAITWSYDIRELQFIYEDYLKKEKKYLTDEEFCKITPKGWAYLESLRQPNPDSKKAFVAMWITDEMKGICENYIKPAAEDAGDYKAEPINEKDYNGDVNDAIIGEIRSSKFIIADFTGNRGGVYYEAGFAYGLHIPVIYTCREDWFNQFVKQSIKLKDIEGNEKEEKLDIFSKIHFDVDHRNFIVWKEGKDLYDKLLKRIEATIT